MDNTRHQLLKRNTARDLISIISGDECRLVLKSLLRTAAMDATLLQPGTGIVQWVGSAMVTMIDGSEHRIPAAITGKPSEIQRWFAEIDHLEFVHHEDIGLIVGPTGSPAFTVRVIDGLVPYISVSTCGPAPGNSSGEQLGAAESCRCRSNPQKVSV